MLGADYKGVIVSDFYGGYNYHLAEHQRCWVHYLRDLEELKEKHPKDKNLLKWAGAVRALYDKAKKFQSENRRTRVKARARFQDCLVRLGEKYEKTDLPQRTLAQRCVKFANEMFTFIEYPDIPSENNPAERAIRPLVIARKISGGTRSRQGSNTRMALASIFETWKLNSHDPLSMCNQLLASSPQ